MAYLLSTILLTAVTSFIDAEFVVDKGNRGLNFVLGSGEEACFYQLYRMNENVVAEYAVISGTYQDHMVGFQVYDVYERPVLTEFRKQSSKVQFQTALSGDYKICIDNTHNRYSQKIVSIRLSTAEVNGTNWETFDKTNLLPEGDYDGKVLEINALVDRVRLNLNEIREIQEAYAHVEHRDRSVVEDSFDRVNKFSLLLLITTICVMVFQVVSLRSFFDDRSAVQRFLRRPKTRY